MSSLIESSVVKEAIQKIRAEGSPRPERVVSESWGRRREFLAFDIDDDTFVFEDGIWDLLENKDPVVIIPKADLAGPEERGRQVYGNVMTVTSGNHAVAALPLLSGKFWDLCALPPESRSAALRSCAVCCNCVSDTLEISQREVSTDRVVEADNWLQGWGFPMDRVLLTDRVDATLERYRREGQEWRIKPLAWTREEMELAIRSARHTISSKGLVCYHNVKGVFFITLGNLRAWAATIESNPESFRKGLAMLVGASEADGMSFVRRPKFGPHCEAEFFGLPPQTGRETVVPAIERLAQEADGLSPTECASRLDGIADEFERRLVSSDLVDEKGAAFVESLYRNLTGEVYQSAGGAVVPAFDDRRAALPGATYLYNGMRFNHPTADVRTDAILSFLESDVSHGDHIEYVNVYEVRSETDDCALGTGKTREIVYKTAWNPLPRRLIEKRLALPSTGYGAYTISRVDAFRALGVSYGPHRLLARHDGIVGDVHFFVRDRYPGESFNQIPAAYFRSADSGDAEDPEIVRALIRVMGAAGAENFLMKKVDRKTGKCLFGKEGKEIVEFAYDAGLRKEMPVRVHLCSIRGTMGWPSSDCTEENLAKVFESFAECFAEVVAGYASGHPSVDRMALADEFLEGFRAKTISLHWAYAKNRELFDMYEPANFKDYRFGERWKFVLWSLDRLRNGLDSFSESVRARVSRA